MNLVRWTNAAKWRDNVERSVNETLVKVGKLGSRVAINEGGIDQLGRDLGSFKQQMDSSYLKGAEQLENLSLEFEVFKVNLGPETFIGPASFPKQPGGGFTMTGSLGAGILC